jgi:crotonobetainyl-CoA:carnitine CoA-transferase CaiB-like acyl-CoA transferase
VAGIPGAQIRSPAEFFGHPQLPATGRLREVGSPGGMIGALMPAVNVRGRELLMRDVPALGRHNDSIRREFGASLAAEGGRPR